MNLDIILSVRYSYSHTITSWTLWEPGDRIKCCRQPWSYKPAIKYGDDVEPTKVLGVLWSPREDTLKVNCTINVHKKIKGARTATDLDFNNLVLPDILTRRIIWRAIMGPYDPYVTLPPLPHPLIWRRRIIGARKICWHVAMAAEEETK